MKDAHPIPELATDLEAKFQGNRRNGAERRHQTQGRAWEATQRKQGYASKRRGTWVVNYSSAEMIAHCMRGNWSLNVLIYCRFVLACPWDKQCLELSAADHPTLRRAAYGFNVGVASIMNIFNACVMLWRSLGWRVRWFCCYIIPPCHTYS